MKQRLKNSINTMNYSEVQDESEEIQYRDQNNELISEEDIELMLNIRANRLGENWQIVREELNKLYPLVLAELKKLHPELRATYTRTQRTLWENLSLAHGLTFFQQANISKLIKHLKLDTRDLAVISSCGGQKEIARLLNILKVTELNFEIDRIMKVNDEIGLYLKDVEEASNF